MIFNLYFFTVEICWRGQLSKGESQVRALVNRLCGEMSENLDLKNEIINLKGGK